MSIRTDSRANSGRRKQEAILDEALKQTFPASDPFSIGRFTATEPPLRPVDRKAPELDTSEVAGRGRKRRR